MNREVELGDMVVLLWWGMTDDDDDVDDVDALVDDARAVVRSDEGVEKKPASMRTNGTTAVDEEGVVVVDAVVDAVVVVVERGRDCGCGCGCLVSLLLV